MDTTRDFTIILEVEDADGDCTQHVIREGVADITIGEILEEHGYDPNSGNSLTMGSPGQWYPELEEVKIADEFTISKTLIEQLVSKQIDDEIINGDIEVDE